MPTIKKSYRIIAEDPDLRKIIEEYLRQCKKEPTKGVFTKKDVHEKEHTAWMETTGKYRDAVKERIKNIYPEFCDGTYTYGRMFSFDGMQVFEVVREIEIEVK